MSDQPEALRLADLLHDECGVDGYVHDEAAACLRRQHAEIAALKAERDALRAALMELRIRLHARGRRPEECYEMSVIDAAIDAAKEGK